MTTTHQDLLRYIGRSVVHQQQCCEVVDVLDKRFLVLQVITDVAAADCNCIQATQHGEGHRQVPVTHTIMVCDAEGVEQADFTALQWVESTD